MNYVILKNYDHYAIVNDDADFIVGRVQPLKDREGPYSVEADLAENNEIAVVTSIEEAIPALAAYYEKNPPRWERKTATRYEKWTQSACLRVEQDQQGNWFSYRDDYPMLRNGKHAIFVTCEEAQRAADVHLLDDYPNCEIIDDGLTWVRDPEIDWRACPHRVEDRAHWQRMASRWLPDCAG